MSYEEIAKRDPGFNVEAARAAEQYALDHPEEIAALAKAMALETINDEIAKNFDAIQDAIELDAIDRIEDVRKALARIYISKAAEGEDPEYLFDLVESLSKASPVSPATIRLLEEKAERAPRDNRGRFRTYKVKMYSKDDPQTPDSVLPSRMAESFAPKSKELKGDRDATHRYQVGMQQLASALRDFSRLPDSDVSMDLYFRNAGLDEDDPDAFKRERVGAKDLRAVDPQWFRGRDLAYAEITVDPTLSVQGASYDLISRFSNEGTANAALGLGSKEARTAWGDFIKPTDRPTPGRLDTMEDRGDFRRIKYASQLIEAVGGDKIGPTGRVATAFGNFVGSHGAEAEKVLGPGTRKIAYRFRGEEKRPDAELQRAIDGTMGVTERDLAAKYGKEMNPEKARIRARNGAREYLIYGPSAAAVTENLPAKERPRESKLIESMARRVPDTELLELQLASGHVPPSEGIIIDSSGTIVTQAVGYGDDWYLPFNLKTLSRVNGGEYVRTRVLGGPTSEDIYTALITEARAVTVVSNSGVYTVEFDKTFRGTRRFGDKAKRMVDRYERLLDAAKSEKVTPSIPQAKMEEIHAQVLKDGFEPGSISYGNEVKRLMEAERANPQIPAAMMEDAKRKFVSDRIERATGMDEATYVERVYLPKYLARQNAAEQTLDGLYDQVAPGMGLRPMEQIQGAGEDRSIQESMARRGAAVELNRRIRVAGDVERIKEQGRAEWDTDPVAAMELADPSVTRAWENEEARQVAAYSRDNRAVRLDSDGYYKALLALQQQFPYYIKRVEHRQIPDTVTDRKGNKRAKAGSRVDAGYVKPRFNRPADARAGYYDASITGRGKVGADRVQHQNWRVSRSDPDSPEEGETRDYQSGTTGPRNESKIARALRQGQRRQQASDLYSEIVRSGQVRLSSAAGEAGTLRPFGQVAGPQYGLATYAEGFGTGSYPILSGDVDRVLANLGVNDPELRSRSDLKGAQQAGPLSQAEFNDLAARAPGFVDAFVREVEGAPIYGDGGRPFLSGPRAGKLEDIQAGSKPVKRVRYDLVEAIQNPNHHWDFEEVRGLGDDPSRSGRPVLRSLFTQAKAIDPVLLNELDSDAMGRWVGNATTVGDYSELARLSGDAADREREFLSERLRESGKEPKEKETRRFEILLKIREVARAMSQGQRRNPKSPSALPAGSGGSITDEDERKFWEAQGVNQFGKAYRIGLRQL